MGSRHGSSHPGGVGLPGRRGGVGGCGSDLDDAVRREIHSQMAAATPPKEAGGVSWRLVRQVYADREERPLWSKHGHPLGRAKDLVASICRAAGKDSGPAITISRAEASGQALKVEGGPEPKDIAALDIRLTAMMLAFGEGPARGPPGSPRGGRRMVPSLAAREHRQHAAGRAQGRRVSRPAGVLRPAQKEYRELVEVLERLPRAAAGGGWPTVPGARRSSAATGDRGSRRCARGSGPPASSTRPRTRSLCSTTRWPRRWRGSRRGTASCPTAASARRPSPRSTSLSNPHQPDRAQPRPVSLAARRIRGSYVLVNIPDFRLRAYDGGGRFSSSG